LVSYTTQNQIFSAPNPPFGSQEKQQKENYLPLYILQHASSIFVFKSKQFERERERERGPGGIGQ
jgi:hypothetical protein